MRTTDGLQSDDVPPYTALISLFHPMARVNERHMCIGECTSPQLARQCAVVIRITKQLNPIRLRYHHQSAAFALAG